MTNRTLTLSALVALSQAKAIVTNNCPHDVYVWSVPQSGTSHAAGISIKSGADYEEAWRYGTKTNPGVAIKISSQADGIYKGADELEFAYSVAGANKSKVWVDLSPVRGKEAFENTVFRTCQGSFTSLDVSTVQCDVSNDIELILCGPKPKLTPTARMIPSSSKMSECHGATSSPKVPGPPVPMAPRPESLKSAESQVSTVIPRPTLSKHIPQAKPSSKPASDEAEYAAPRTSTSKAGYAPPSTFKYATPETSTSKSGYTPPRPVTDEIKYHAPEPTTSHAQYAPPIPTSAKPYASPKATDEYSPPSKPAYALPSYTSEDSYSPPVESKGHSAPLKPTTKHTSPAYNAEESHGPSKPSHGPPGPHKVTPEYAQPASTSQVAYASPESSKGHSGPPKVTDSHGPAPHHEDNHGPAPKESSKAQASSHGSTSVHYSAPSPISKAYKAPSSALNAYKAPSTTSKAYNTPSTTSVLYKAPTTTSKSYNAPSTSSKVYDAPSTMSKAYKAPSSVSEAYKAPSSVSEAYKAPILTSKAYKAPASSVIKSTSVESAYASPAATGHGTYKDTSDEIDDSAEEEEGEESTYALPDDKPKYPAPQSTKVQAHHPHSPPSKPTTAKAYSAPQEVSKRISSTAYAKPTEHETSTGTPYATPAQPTHGAKKNNEDNEDKDEGHETKKPLSRFRRSTIPLSAVLHREASKSRRQVAAPKVCFNHFYEPTLPGMTRANAQSLLDAYLTVKGKAFSQVMNTNVTECGARGARTHNGRHGVCVQALCGALGGSCSDVEDDLEEAALAAFDQDVDYTTDDDVCA